MDAQGAEARGRSSFAARAADLVLAGIVVLVVGMMIVPLPTPVLDVLLASNIAASIVLLLVAVHVPDALSFASFPTLLLVTTLFRLALNVSSTRLVLLQADAGRVIRAFGEFVVQGDYAVGAIVFVVLTLIQYVVIARGSERVAEVGARFTLDALPGKQMAIDAELRAGAIGQDEARRRRRHLARESQFYGAMDGAMKFVKGDAIAGMVIVAVNLVGGAAIGVLARGLSLSDALATYGLLSIGDGLVTQIPSILVSTAAGLVVTRVASEEEGASLGSEVGRQILAQPRALAIAALLLLALAVVPGLPTLPFLLLAVVLGSMAFALVRARRRARVAAPTPQFTPGLDALRIELGPVLAARIDSGEPSVLDHALAEMRERVFASLGVVVPEARLRRGAALADRFVVSLSELPVHEGVAGGADAAAQAAYVASVAETYLRMRASELVGITETQAMLDRLEATASPLVRQVVPKPIGVALLADVLRRLLDEGVSIRPLREILEALALAPATEKDAGALADHVRVALRRHLTARYAPGGAVVTLALDPELEEAVRDGIKRTSGAVRLAVAPDVARVLVERSRAAIAAAPGAVIVAASDVRRFVRAILANELPGVPVLSADELDPMVRVQLAGRIAP